MVEHFKIILLCLAAALVYRILHDQITARVCVESFTVFHPPIFATHSPTLLALGWGVFATWWVGLFLGLLLTLAARAGSRPKLTAATLVHPIGHLLIVVACSAFIAGSQDFFWLSTVLFWNRSGWLLCSLHPAIHASWLTGLRTTHLMRAVFSAGLLFAFSSIEGVVTQRLLVL